MTLREYRPISAQSKIKKEQFEQATSDFNKLWLITNPESHHCLQFGGYTLVKSDKIEARSLISVNTPEKQKKQRVIKTFPEHLQTEIKNNEKELNLTLTHLKKLQKEVEDEKIKRLELAKQLEFMKKKAFEHRTETDYKNFIKNFRTRYAKFNSHLSEDLKKLESEVKKEFLDLLNDLKQRIDEVCPYLEQQK